MQTPSLITIAPSQFVQAKIDKAVIPYGISVVSSPPSSATAPGPGPGPAPSQAPSAAPAQPAPGDGDMTMHPLLYNTELHRDVCRVACLDCNHV